MSLPLNRNLIKVSTWCNLWGIRMNPTKTRSMIVSRSRTIIPAHSDLFVGNTSLNLRDSFRIFGFMFDNKFTFKRHICSISSSVAQKIGLLRKSVVSLGIMIVLLRCFNSDSILPCLKSLSLQIFNSKSHYTVVCSTVILLSSLCTLYKIFHNPLHPLHS